MPPRRYKRSVWKTALAWIASIVGALIVLVIVAAFVLLHSKAVHQYVLRVGQQKASAALGTKVSVRDFALRFSAINPAVDIYDVVIAGAPATLSSPLARAQRLHVRVTITSLLHRKWYIDDIELLQPVVRLQVDADGSNNLPNVKSSGGNSNISVFDLGIRHISIRDGSLFYNDRKTVLDADAYQLNFSSVYDLGQNSYSGRMSYRNGEILTRNFAPVPHQLDAEFVAAPDVFTLKRAVLQSGNSTLEISGTVQDYSNPQIDAHYDATLVAGEFQRILRNQSLPAGVIKADGTVAYKNQPNRPFLDALNVSGSLGSKRLVVATPSFRQNIDDMAATYKLLNANLFIPDLRARLLGGELIANMSIRDLSGNSHSHLHASLRSASLKSAQAIANTKAVSQIGISGAVNATTDATWSKTLSDLVVRADATVKAQIAGNRNSNPVPLDAALHGQYAAARKQLDLATGYLRTPQTVLTMSGSVSKRSVLKVNLATSDLHELESIAAVIRPGMPALGLYGTASLNGTVSGSTDSPQVAVQLSSSSLRVRGTSWRRLQMNAQVSPSKVSIRSGELDPVKRGRITFALDAGLKQWTFSNNSPLQLSLNASQIDLEEVTRVAGLNAPISGTLAAAVSMHGSEQNPIGNGRLSLTHARVEDEVVNSLTLQFRGAGDDLFATLNAQMPAGAASGQVTLHPKQRTYEAQVQANGIHLDQLETIKQRDISLSGIVNLNASGKGTFDNPQLNATLEIPELDVRNQKISGIKLQTSLADHVGTLDLRSDVVNTSITARGTVRLSGDYYADARIDTQTIPFEPLVAVYAPSQAGNIGGQTELHATIHGPLKKKDLIEAHITIPQLALNYKNQIKIAETEPIRADYANGTLQVPRDSLRGTGTDLQFQATVPVTRNVPASVLLQGSVDLQLASLFDPDIHSSGQLRFDINSYGRRADPNVHGEVRIVNANFASDTVPLGLQNGNGTLTLLSDRLQITKFEATVGGGDFNASGAVIYRPAMRFDVAFGSKNTRALYDNIRSAFNTKFALAGNLDSAQLQGQVNVEQLQFTPAFDLMNLMGQLGGGASTPPPVGGFEQALRLNVGINSTAGVNLVSRTMSLQAAANLRLTGTAAQPIVLGRINLNGGDLIFRGNRYILQGGTIDFVNPSQTLPVLNVSVNTQVQQYNVQMHFWGPADHLHTNYSSDPALPPSDIINLIAFGNTSEASAANPSPPGNLAAEEFVASQVSSQITSRVEKVAGLSQLSVDPLLGTNQGESPGARITIQRRVTGKIFVTFSTDTTSTQNSVIKVEFQQSPRVSYSGTRDQNGGFGFDRRIHKEW